MPDGAARVGWRTHRFDEMAVMVNDRVDDPSLANVDYYVGLEHLDSDSLTIRRWGAPSDVEATKLRFRAGDIIFGRRRVYQRKLAVAHFNGICSAHAMVLRAKADAVLPEFLPFFMQSDLFMERARQISVGSLSPTINWRTLANEEFALPAVEEQRRMADVLWALEDLKRAVIAQQSRELSLSNALFRSMAGLITSEDETAIIRGELKTTRRGWPIRAVSEICTRDRQGVQVGPFGGSVSNRYFSTSGVPVLKINNISEDGNLDLEDVVHLEEAQAGALSRRYSVRAGDLVTAAQATIGRTAIIDKRVDGAIISQHLIRISTRLDVCLPDWLHSCFCAPLVLRQLHSVVQGGTRAGLNTNDVANILIPVPPLVDQELFVGQMATARGLRRANIDRAKQTDRLKQSMMVAMRRIDV
ncbi:MAG: restriction endonuclease subunit S [Ardenticatenales bacterium]|nr:restriction endonuclease subunit S [Ardenticatenales bacterium]